MYIVADRHLNTLIGFKRRRRFEAQRGAHGQGKGKHGRSGQYLHVKVPLGTVARDAETGELIADLTGEGQKVLVAQGGRGGRGNAAFATPTNQAPRFAERGEPVQGRWLLLELKLIADVGIIGCPNAGKSTLLAAVSAARPKIADYPFTTLTPNLGVVAVDEQSFVMADLPGLIEGAHAGAGLGHDFLRHIERTKILVHLLDGASPDPIRDFIAINEELALFNPILARKPQVVALNKMDLPEARGRWPLVKEEMEARGLPALAISALRKEGLPQLLHRLVQLLESLPPEEEPLEVKTFRPSEEDRFTISREGEAFIVRGKRVERVAVMTDWGNEEAVARFQRVMAAMGVTMALREAGVRPGDTVRIGDAELEWQ